MRKALFVLASLSLVGCTPDWTGILASETTGELIEPSAARGDPLSAIHEACGTASEPGGELVRLPYVQRVHAGGGRVTWTTRADEPERLEVWTVDAPHTTVTPEVDPTRYLADARQVAVELGSLEPSTIHCYQVLGEGDRVVYGPTGFRTAPATGADEEIDIVVFGDSGFASDDQAAVATQMAAVPMDLMLHVGDVAYGEGTLPQYEANHFAMYRAFSGSIPLFPAIGDHDDATDQAGPYREVFALPENGGPEAAERWYSFDWGPVHVVVLDAFRGGSAQDQFLERDLAQAAGATWKIVVVSTPLYSSGWHGGDGNLRRAYGPVFARHGVDLVLSGDDHDYERTRPIEGVTYVVTGGGGRSVRPVGTSSWTAFSTTAFHFVKLEITRETLRLHAIDATGREFDGVELTR